MTSTLRDELRIVHSGHISREESVKAWADIENTEHPTNVTAQVELHINNEGGGLIGPDVILVPPLKSRVTRTSLTWYPSLPSQLNEVDHVDAEVVGTYNSVMGSADDGHQVVDQRRKP